MRTFQNIILRDLEIADDKNKTCKFNAEPISIKWASEGSSPIDTLSEKIEECQKDGYSLLLAFKTQNEQEKILDLLKERGYENIASSLGDLSIVIFSLPTWAMISEDASLVSLLELLQLKMNPIVIIRISILICCFLQAKCQWVLCFAFSRLSKSFNIFFASSIESLFS